MKEVCQRGAHKHTHEICLLFYWGQDPGVGEEVEYRFPDGFGNFKEKGPVFTGLWYSRGPATVTAAKVE